MPANKILKQKKINKIILIISSFCWIAFLVLSVFLGYLMYSGGLFCLNVCEKSQYSLFKNILMAIDLLYELLGIFLIVILCTATIGILLSTTTLIYLRFRKKPKENELKKIQIIIITIMAIGLTFYISYTIIKRIENQKIQIEQTNILKNYKNKAENYLVKKYGKAQYSINDTNDCYKNLCYLNASFENVKFNINFDCDDNNCEITDDFPQAYFYEQENIDYLLNYLSNFKNEQINNELKKLDLNIKLQNNNGYLDEKNIKFDINSNPTASELTKYLTFPFPVFIIEESFNSREELENYLKKLINYYVVSLNDYLSVNNIKNEKEIENVIYYNFNYNSLGIKTDILNNKITFNNFILADDKQSYVINKDNFKVIVESPDNIVEYSYDEILNVK